MIEILTDGDVRGTLQTMFAILVCGAAFFLGGKPERIIAATWLICFDGLPWLKAWWTGESMQLVGVDPFAAAMDLLAGAIFVAVALYANRNYPLWIAGMQLMAITAHMARGFSEIISPIAYTVLVVVPGWFQLVFLAIGLFRHIRREQLYGRYRDWRVVGGRPPTNLPLGTPGASAGSLLPGQTSWRDELK